MKTTNSLRQRDRRIQIVATAGETLCFSEWLEDTVRWFNPEEDIYTCYLQLIRHRLFLYRHLRSVREPLLGNRPISDVRALFLTNVFYFIHRLRGLSLCALQRFLCRLLFIHSWLNCGSEKALRTARLEAWTPRTSSGQSGESHTPGCTELQASRSSSRPADRRGSPVQQISITRDTPR